MQADECNAAVTPSDLVNFGQTIFISFLTLNYYYISALMIYVAVWRSSNALVSYNEVAPR